MGCGEGCASASKPVSSGLTNGTGRKVRELNVDSEEACLDSDGRVDDDLLHELREDLLYLLSRAKAVQKRREEALARITPIRDLWHVLRQAYDVEDLRVEYDSLNSSEGGLIGGVQANFTLHNLRSLTVGDVGAGFAGFMELMDASEFDKLGIRCPIMCRLSRLALLFISFMLLHPNATLAALTHEVIYRFDRIELSRIGTWCWRPGPEAYSPRTCVDPALSSALKAHLNNKQGSGLSIQYFDRGDGSVLGGASWSSWNATPLPTVLCLAGRVDGVDGQMYRTNCYLSSENDDFASRTARATECTINKPQRRVTDGCYEPPATGGFNLSAQATSILTVFGVVIGVLSCGLFAWLARRLWARWRGAEKQMDTESAVNTPSGAISAASDDMIPAVPVSL